MDNTIVILTIQPAATPASKLSPGLSSGAVCLAGRSEQQDKSLHAMNLAMPATTKTALVKLLWGPGGGLTLMLSSAGIIQTEGRVEVAEETEIQRGRGRAGEELKSVFLLTAVQH